MISINDLKPKVIDVRINNYGDDLVIPLMLLTSVQWQNVGLGLDRPSAEDYKIRKLVDGKHTDVVNHNDPEYVEAVNNYSIELKLRRLAIAIDGGNGVKEFAGKTLEEQVEILKAMDMGIVNALTKLLEDMSLRKKAVRFQPIRENSHADMQSDEVDVIAMDDATAS